MRKPSYWLWSATTALLVSACGGGGGDAAQSAGPFAVNAALGHLLVTGGSWTMNGTANGQGFTLTLAFAPVAAGPFPVTGAMSAQSLQTLTLVSAGQSNSGTDTIYFDAATHAIVGLQADGACSVATANTALPVTAAAGASGAIFTESDLDGCTNSSLVLGSATNSWSVASDTGIALLCWNLAATDAAGTPNGTESICIEVAADGTLGRKARFAFAAGAVTISARNF